VRPVDIGRVSCLSAQGAPVTRCFLGSAGLGLAADITRRLGASRIAKFFGHRFALRLHGWLARRIWRARRVRLMAGGADEIAGITHVALTPRDGQFNIAILDGGQAFSGTPRQLRGTRLTVASTLDTSGRVAVETDGEAAGFLPATFEIMPSALNLRV
jgi:diacylglycerol kinase family enzyme